MRVAYHGRGGCQPLPITAIPSQLALIRDRRQEAEFRVIRGRCQRATWAPIRSAGPCTISRPVLNDAGSR